MDLTKVLAQLREELAQVNAAILSLEQLHSGGKRRGRPPRWISEIKESAGLVDVKEKSKAVSRRNRKPAAG
jgi:hypothetical protein